MTGKSVKAKKLNISQIRPGDKVKLACGGWVEVRETEYGTNYYPFGLRFKSFHASDMPTFNYDKTGECGQGTGLGQCPFDITEIKRKRK